MAIPARAEDGSESPSARDRYSLWVHGETNAVLFSRALLPGPAGTVVETDTIVPIRQDVRLRATDIDTGWREDSIDLELAAWAAALPGDDQAARPVDGGVQSANARYRHGPVAFRLGRQRATSAASRYARFDGLDVAAQLGGGVRAGVYGGLGVLPLWNQNPAYFALGAPTREVLVDPSVVENPERSEYWMTGGVLGYDHAHGRAEVSYHEQHVTGGVGRRNLAANGRYALLDELSAGVQTLLDTDSWKFADARAWIDATPVSALDLSVEYFRTTPGLLLSRQSVLSVFSTSAYNEGGATLEARPLERLSLEASGWLVFYDTGHPGGRAEGAVRIVSGRARRTQFRVGYTRVLAPDNGYNAARISLAQRLLPPLLATLEAYGYFYDEAIESVRTSTVYAGTLTWQANDPLSILVGASLARSPYAAADAQAQIRASYNFDFSTRGPPR